MNQPTYPSNLSDSELKEKLIAQQSLRIRNQSIAIKALIVILFIIVLFALWTFQCIKGGDGVNIDSLRLALDIEKKQHGNDQAILLNDAERIARKLFLANNAKDSIRQREINLTSTNLTLMKKLRTTLPKECDTVFVLCDEIINVKDSSYSALFSAFMLCDSANYVKDALISSYQAENVTDSLRLVVSDKQTAAAKKEAKKQKRAKLTAYIVGGAMGIIYVITNILN